MPPVATVERTSPVTGDPRIEGKRFIVNEFAVNQGWNASVFCDEFNKATGRIVQYRTFTSWINGQCKPKRAMLKLLCEFMCERDSDLKLKPKDLESHYDLAKDRKR